MRLEIVLLFLGMTLATYIPRAIPAALSSRMHFPPKVEKFLKLIPYTAMAAIIFPGVLTADAANPAFGMVGALTALVLGLRKCSVMVCVLGAVAAEFLLYLIF